MAGKIFINYRRDDAIAVAGRLHDRLVQAFGRKNLFMDVDHIPAGVDFVGYLNAQVAACDVFLAVMGKDWLDARDENGQRRIDNPKDFVVVEITAALARDIRVIPVLVDGARMPKEDALPEALQPLVRRNAVELRNAQFGRDADALIEKVRAALGGDKLKSVRWPIWTASVAALVLAGWLGAYQLGLGVWVPWSSEVAKPEPTMTDKAKAEAKRIADLAATKATELTQTVKAKAEAELERRRAAAVPEVREIRAFKAQSSETLAYVSADGSRIFTDSKDTTSRLWNAETGEEIAGGSYDNVNRVAFSADGSRFVLAFKDGTARVIDAATARQIATLRGPSGDWPGFILWSPNNQRILGKTADKTTRLWDANTGTELASIGGDAFAFFHRTGTYVTARDSKQKMRVFDAQTGRLIVGDFQSKAIDGSLSLDGTRLLIFGTFDDPISRILDLRTSKELISLPSGPLSTFNPFVLSPDNTRAVTVSFEKTMLWDAQFGREITILHGHKTPAVMFSPDAKHILTRSFEDPARLWDAATGKMIAVLANATPFAFAPFSANSKRILTVKDDNFARLWDALTGTEIAQLRQGDKVFSAQFIEGSKYVLTRSVEKKAAVWNAETGQELAGTIAEVHSALFSKDGRRMVTGHTDGVVRIWALPP